MLGFPCSANAAPRNIDDCEAIKEANAYNLCLASFGPSRGQRVKTYPGAAKSVTGRPQGAGAKHGSRPVPRFAGAQIARGRGGRVRMEFTPRAR
ncbi:MAG: hypothetical protein N2444_09555 [Methylocystis sp.]|nr:hypothetical protein [Methylocystis sp.]